MANLEPENSTPLQISVTVYRLDSVLFKKKMFTYFEKEREREEGGAEAEGERKNPKQTLRCQHRAQCQARTHCEMVT